MHPRIRQLAVQAGIKFIYDPTEVPTKAFIEAWEKDLEKFTELLIRDCAKIADIAEPWRSGDLLLDYYGIPHDNRMQP